MFIVCGNRTMVEMCRLLPTSKAELLELHGMGELKVQRYGELLLDALRPHVDRLRAHHEAMGLSSAESAGEQSMSTLVAEEAD
jgi:ATP-dependent DNA helicase RecQ